MELLKDIFRRMVRFFTSGSERSVVTICFLLSTLFFILIKFSKEYTYYIDYPVEFVNQPIEKYLKEKPLSNLKVKVSGFGFNFIKEKFTSRKVEIDVSKLPYNSNRSSYYWLAESNQSELAISLNGFSIVEIEPDTLFLNFSNKTKKRVEVKVPLELEFRENYIQYSALKVEPSTIEVYGPSHLIDTLTTVFTKPLVASDVVDDIDEDLELLLPNELISSRDISVRVHQDVERFTQIDKIVPIKLKNLHSGKEVYLKPASVELSYWVAMQDVDKVSDSDFYIYCDYNEAAMGSSTNLNVFIDHSKYPSIVKRVRYSPTTIEFIDL